MLSPRTFASGVLLLATLAWSSLGAASPDAASSQGGSKPAAPKEGKGDATKPAANDESGFVPLFNGKDLTGWTGDTKGYLVEDGAIVCGPEGRNLYTSDEFGNFSFRFEFKLTPGANNGIGIRTPSEGDAAYVGMEVQILDNTAKQYESLKDYQFHGSIYGIAAAKREFLKPVGDWNAEEIIANGRSIKVILNGETIVDVNLDEITKNGTLDGKEHPGLKNAKGHIGFCGHGDRVMFRNVRVKSL
ncbi:MAG: DUF1080 domain-containing protein [Phycisphaerae bacterium]|jgi:hypothetical protein|nr:DUF1080 domain-containing protein [Phycisphaerae bacterium]